jgi:hypothetical protein
MKTQLLITLFSLNSLISFSQTNTITVEDTNLITTKRWRDTCFGLIDKSASQIPSGYLMDYSLVGLNDSSFNGIYTSNDTVIDCGVIFALQGIFNSAKVNNNGTLPPSTDSLFIDANRYQRNTGYIPLLFLFQPYQKIRTTAFSQGLFTITPDSVRLLDVAGRSTSPYDSKTFFAFSSLQSNITQFNNITFSMPSEFWLMNGITSVSIDFGDGNGFRTLSKNGTVNIYYNTTGTKYLTAKIITSYGTLTAKSSIQYQRPVTYTKADTTWNISVPPVYSSFEQYLGNTQTPSGSGCPGEGSIFDSINCDINPGAIVHIVNGCDRVFDKPIIIVEGFDPLNQIDYTFLENNFRFYQFYDYMRSLGYDFVFVDFTKNTDFIENNAKVLEQVIDNVNALKTGTNTSTIIGWSMGGLITRWCLKDMEDRGLTHKVGKFFSYDAPQQGANIPLGLQYFFKEMLNDMPWLKLFSKDLRKLNAAYASPAAIEMLVTKANYSNNFFPILSTLDPTRSKFAQSLINKGYPHQSVNYGISFGRGNNVSGSTSAGNGSQFGNFQPGSSIFDGTLIYLLENVKGTGYAVPVNSLGKICSYRYYGYKVVKLFGFPIAIAPILRTRNIKYQGQYPYDDAPGGYEDTQNQFAQDFNSAATIFGVQIFGSGTTHNHFGHNFISEASALDLQNQGYGSSNLFQSNNMYGSIDNSIVNPGQVAGNALNPTSLSPFNYVMTYTSDCSTETCQSWDDAFSTVEGTNWNLHHEAPISNQAALFMERKILSTNPVTTCPSLCNNSDYHITSDAAPICNTTMLHLKSAYPIDYNINWTFPNGLLSIQNGQGTPDVTVKAVGNGVETATVIVTNSCGQQATYILSVSVGSPIISIAYSMNGGCNGTYQTWSLAASSPNPVSTWLWTVDNPNSGSWYIYHPTFASTFVDVSGGGGISVTATNVCGSSKQGVTIYSNCGHSNAIIASPNPTSSDLTVSLTQPLSTASASTNSKTQTPQLIYQILVADQVGNVRKQFNYSAGVNSTKINLTGLLSGTYTIVVFDGINWNGVQVIKE